MHLSSSWYEQKRNKLISMLEEANRLEIPKHYAEELESASKKSKENAFEIVLVGEFQGGKSTTFNALCDGRDISPRGLGGGGIKTSAAVISAQNISGNETKNGLSEWAELSFKSLTDLALGMYNLLFPALRNNKTFRSFFPKLSDDDFALKISSPRDFAEMLDLDNEKHLRVLKKIIASLWKKWQADRMSYSDDELDMLRITTLQVKFYNSPEYNEMLNKSVLAINDFQNLVAFPTDWTIKWLKGEDADFLFHEIAFVFISSVLVRIHSKNLARIGCRITDCPGLFANAYDTSVTKQTIAQADAVWYLLNGEKQIGQKDLEMIRQIYEMGMHDKLNISFNLRGSHAQKIKEILPVTVAALENSGYNVQVDPYNARLAFLATQGDLLLNERDKFSERDLECMRFDSKIDSTDIVPAKVWSRMIRRLGISLDLLLLEDITELNSEAAEVVRKESYLDDILTHAEEYVINKKSKSILIDNGSKKAIRALEDFEGELKLVEEAAKNKEEEWEEKVAEARKQLDLFFTKSKKALDKSRLVRFKTNFSQQIAREIIDEYLLCSEGFIEITTRTVSQAVHEARRRFFRSKKSWVAYALEKSSPGLMQGLENGLASAIAQWQAEKDASFDDLKFRVKDVHDTFKQLWDEQKLNISPFFQGLQMPEIAEGYILHCCSLLSQDLFSKDSKIMEDLSFLWIESVARAFLKAVAFIFKLPFKIIGKLSTIAKNTFYTILEDSDAQRELFDAQEQREKEQLERKEEIKLEEIEKLVKEFRDEIKKSFDNEEFRSILRTPIEEAAFDIQKKLISQLQAELRKLRNDFEQNRCQRASAQFQKSQAERQRIANENAELRKNKIQPLRERLQQFEKTVLEIV